MPRKSRSLFRCHRWMRETGSICGMRSSHQADGRLAVVRAQNALSEKCPKVFLFSQGDISVNIVLTGLIR